MKRSQEWNADAALIVRWLARIGSLISIGILLGFLIGEGGDLAEIRPQEWVLLIFFPFGVMIGLALGWRNEGLGGLIAVASLAAFYWLETAFSGNGPGGPFFAIFTFPGVLFLISWWLDHGPRVTGGGQNMSGAHR